MVETRVVTYKNHSDMKRGIRAMAKKGFEARTVVVMDQGYGCLKTLVLGIIFLPLALLGRKPQMYTVHYERVK